jgi:hypothetical protein
MKTNINNKNKDEIIEEAILIHFGLGYSIFISHMQSGDGSNEREEYKAARCESE